MIVKAAVGSEASQSVRARQLAATFDCPSDRKQRRSWKIDVDIDHRSWNIGLIVGPSGSGKTTLLRQFGEPTSLIYKGKAVIDDFDQSLSIDAITAACQAVGFNTIPAWLRPYETLSNGEQFRVMMARLLIEQTDGPVIVDEFTSVVDRQVAKIAAHAVARYCRKQDRQMIVASCHTDVIDWLQPDWVIEPDNQSFSWRSVQPRPKIDCTIAACRYSEWSRFAPYHYMSADLARAARTFGLYVDGQPAAFLAMLHRPIARGRSKSAQDMIGVSRIVTLPDWQGVGFGRSLVETVAAAYKTIGKRVNHYPAHAPYIRSLARSPHWRMIKRPGFAVTQRGHTNGEWVQGNRPCATMRYVGPELDREAAADLLSIYHRIPYLQGK